MGLDPRPGNFCMPWVQPKKKKFDSGIPKILKFALLRNMVGHVALPETQDVFAFIKMINTVSSCLTAW